MLNIDTTGVLTREQELERLLKEHEELLLRFGTCGDRWKANGLIEDIKNCIIAIKFYEEQIK